MPYRVVPVPGGYKVKKDVPGTPRYYSTMPLSNTVAKAQLRALYASERKRT